MGFPYIPGVVFSFFYQSAMKHLHFSHTEVILITKCYWFLGSLIVYHFISKSFILVHGTQLQLQKFGYPARTTVKTRLKAFMLIESIPCDEENSIKGFTEPTLKEHIRGNLITEIL